MARLIHSAGVAFTGLFVTTVALAQDSPNATTAKVAPAYFSSDDTDDKSVGASWEARLARAWTGSESASSTVPTTGCLGLRPAPEITAELATDGAAALDPDANSTPIRASGKVGLWWSLYKPGCPGPDPMQPPRGGWYFGSTMLSAHAKAEGNQRMTEATGLLGADLLWTHSAVTGVWPFVPSLQVAYSAAIPIRSEIRDALGEDDEVYQRGEAHAAWHIPLVARFWLHANVRGWKSWGLASSLADADADEGLFTAIDLAYRGEWKIGVISIPEIFVRRVDGEVPEDWQQRRTWMIGIVTGR